MKIKAQKKEKIILYTIFAFYCLILWLVLIDRGFIAYLVTKESFFESNRTATFIQFSAI